MFPGASLSIPIPKRTSAVLFALALFAFPQASPGWETATHVYMAKQLGHQIGLANVHEMYGAALPDFPNLLLGYAHANYLYRQTHYEYMNLVRLAPFGYQRALAYGFASHNEAWAADYTAHKQALVSGQGGYVVQKIPGLAAVLYSPLVTFLTGKVNDPASMANELATILADTCIEGAIDLLVSEREFKEVGVEMMVAAALRSSFVPSLLASAYAKGLAKQAGISESQATAILTAAEAKHREYVMTYGAVLTQPNRWDLLAEMIAQVGAQFLATPPYNLSVQPGELKPLTAKGLAEAKLAVQYDYAAELAATAKHVGAELLKRLIFTSLVP